MRTRGWWVAVILTGAGAGFAVGVGRDAEAGREEPPVVVTPGVDGSAPSDAVVLFDGTDLDAFTKPDGQPAHWKVEDGCLVVQRGGPLVSRETFGDAQIHVEFRTPSPAQGNGQGRGNSGVYVQARYEVQVLDSFENETYPNGQAGAIYGHHAPLVNACRKPGEWQSYDIIFRSARYDDAGAKVECARMTVLHNGVLIQDHAEVPGSTTASMSKEGPDDGPLYLQDHGNPVLYRNIWVRRL